MGIINSLKEETKLKTIYLGQLFLPVLMQLLDMPNLYNLATSALLMLDGFLNFIHVDTHDKVSIAELNAVIKHPERFGNSQVQSFCQFSGVYSTIKSNFL